MARKKINKRLADQILAMAREDQRIRKWALRGKDKEKLRSRFETVSRIDSHHTARMKKVVARYGWPGRSLVGARASFMAWLLVQHADRALSFQRRCLRLLQRAVNANEAQKKALAYLTDRVLVHEGKKQLYGTQLQGDKSQKYTPFPIADPKSLNKRRKEMGLEPFSQYLKKFLQNR